MPKRNHLSDFERGQILAYNDQKLSQTEISLKIGRDQSTISKFLSDPVNYGQKKRSGSPLSLDTRAERRILKAASEGNLTAKAIKIEQNIPLTVRRVLQIISSSPNLILKKKRNA